MAERKCGLCEIGTAACACTCTFPHFSLCSACLLGHISTPGNHVVEAISQAQPTASVNEFCSMCLSSTGESVCGCEDAGLVLCGKCIPPHTSKIQSKVHIILPIKARTFISRPGYVDRLRGRQQALEKSIINISKSLSRIDTCRSLLRKRVENYLQMVNLYRENRLEELNLCENTLRKTIEAVKREISEHIYEEDYKPESPFVASVWNSSGNNEDLFKFSNKGPYEVEITLRLGPDLSFIAVKSPVQPASTAKLGNLKAKPKANKPKPPKQKQSAPITPIPRTPARSGRASPRTSFDPSTTLIQMTSGRIELYNCFSQTATQLCPIPALASQMSSTLILPNGNIFISGKEKPLSAIAIELDSVSAQQIRLLDMYEKRFGHGTLHDGRSVYVFGGSGTGSQIAQCEAFHLQTRQWRRLANMTTPRDFFNPCLYSCFVYIFGGRKTNLCEKYSIGENRFYPLGITMPVSGQCCSAVNSSSVVIVQRKYTARWRFEAGEFDRVWTEGAAEACWGNCSPVVVNNTVMIAMSHHGKILHMRIPTN